jgi:hypothetical protein
MKPFHERIDNYSAKEIAARIGCPIPTVYDWKAGRRSPPPWVQEIVVEILGGNYECLYYENTTK